MSDPLRRLDEIPVTLVIAIAYATLFVVCRPFGEPEEFGERLARFGWASGEQVAAGEPWRLLSHAFLHGNVLHLLLNLSALLSIGPGLECKLGSARFLLLYVVTALGGALATCLLYRPEVPVVGGSGALFGMLGCAIAMNMRAGRHLLAFLEFDGPRRLLTMVFAYLLLGLVLPVSNTGHAGGLVTGFTFALLWLAPGPPSPKRTAWRAATTALLTSVTFAVLQPVTRYDWLSRASERATTPEQRDRLERASELAFPR